MDPLTAAEFEPLARRRLPAEVWDFLAGGSGEERTLAANRAAFGRYALLPRAMVDVSRVELASTVLGDELASPIGIAPTAYHRLFDPGGEIATAGAAAQAGALFVVSVFASQHLTEIATAANGPLWLQLYWFRERAVMVDLAKLAEQAGCRALVLTIDTPRVGRRLRDLRSGFAVPAGIVAANVDPALMSAAHRRRPGTSALAEHSRQQLDPGATWQDLRWLREQTRLPLVLKGVLSAADARQALAHGAAGVIVSNHGGRQLDGTVASLEALPEVVGAVAGRCPVLFDGGIRTGTDVLKALALGASVVLVGRPALWGLAAAGGAGVGRVLELLTAELEDAMVLSGRPRLRDIDRTLVRRIP